VFALGSGTNPVVNFSNPVNARGNTNVWTLQVTDTNNGLSAQSQITIFVQMPPPQGMQVSLQVATK